MSGSARRWNAWGFEGVSFPLDGAARRWLEARVGRGEPLPAVAESELQIPDPRPLPPWPAASAADAWSRLRHACGQSYPDIVALRTGTVAAYPDAVVFPESAEQVVGVLRTARETGVAVVIRGGGTSVVGGVTVGPGDRPVVVLSLERLRGLLVLDDLSRLATFRAGTLGPEVEAALGARGFRLGHEPQSFELVSIGGCAATRSAGQRSTGVGQIEDLVAGAEVATAGGVWRLPPQPSSAAGPELRRVITGSEGRLGAITAVTVRVRPLPAGESGAVALLPGWSEGIAMCRALLQEGVNVEVMRLSDADESSLAVAVLHLPALVAAVFRRLLARERFRNGCLLLLGWTGTATERRTTRSAIRRHRRAARGLGLGSRGFASWKRDRFRHPYLRDELLSAGWGVDTLETAAPWATLPLLHERVRQGVTTAAARAGFKVAILCHLSHAYRDGASLYFTLLWPLARGRELEQWAALKHAATDALLAAGGTLTHHHGVGTMHAPYFEREVGPQGVALVRALATAADPAGILNPGVLLADTAGVPTPGKPEATSTVHGPRAMGGREGGP